MSRPGVDESSERDFIKMILTKDQGRSKGNEKGMRIRKSGCVELNWTHCCTGEFNATLSLCGVLGVYGERKPFGLFEVRSEMECRRNCDRRFSRRNCSEATADLVV